MNEGHRRTRTNTAKHPCLSVFICGLFTCGVASSASAAERYDPSLRFRTIRTAHFDIHSHQGEDALARRLAAIVERVHDRFQPLLGVARGRVHVILVDQTDVSNGWATPLPYDTIEITAAPPIPESEIGNTTDWLELVFTHEYTHILHLDRSRGFIEGVRRVFGRVPVAFPNLYLPTWQVEGLAVYQESRLTGEGRVPAGDFGIIVDDAAATGRFEPIDRAGGGLDDWPRGDAPYAYGAYFHQFLADRYGPERLSRLADATAGRVPLLGGGAFQRVYGRSAPQLWREFREARESRPRRERQTDARATRVTHHGFSVTALRADDRGALYYTISDSDRFPRLMRLAPGGVPEQIAWRSGGNRTSVRGDWVVFDRVERVHSVAIASDLYAVHTTGGAVHRLTTAARASDPDLSPDRRRIICTVERAGRHGLALLDFSPATEGVPRIVVSEDDEDYAGPRWSPDGNRIVAERRNRAGYELVIVDAATFTVNRLIGSHDARLVTPTWTPDGHTILFAANVEGEPFNVFSVDIATHAVRRVTDSVSGAKEPQLSSDGVLTYVGYTPDGYDVFSIPTAPSEWKPVDFGSAGDFRATADFRLKAEATATDHECCGFQLQPDDLSSRAYNPLRTLVPTYWSPLLASDAGETLIGAATAMTDALGRHAYAIDAGWSSARGRPDWHASYAYDRWRPTIAVSYGDDTDPIAGGETRSQELFAGVRLPFRRVRWTETLMGAFDIERDTASCIAACRAPDRELHSIRGGWRHDSRRAFGYSISPEEGSSAEVVVESSRTGLGSDVNAGAAVVDLRGYRRLFDTHAVLAARVAAASAWGALAARRIFSASGPGGSFTAFDFGRDAVGLLRGVDADAFVGSRAATASLDLRFPLARMERGIGTWPLFFRTLHGAVFLDAADAWDRTFRGSDVRTSAGAELSLDLVVAHALPVTLATGAAWIRDPRDVGRAAAFGRIGYAF
jgi:Tol biopolymer transport system component